MVPVVPLVNDPDLANRGQSEIALMLPMQNALNWLMSDSPAGAGIGSRRAVQKRISRDDECLIQEGVSQDQNVWTPPSSAKPPGSLP